MAHIVVIGAGLGGLATAYELRQVLPSQHRVTLISEHAQFTFIPGLIRVALDLTPLDHLQLDLATLTRRHRLAWVRSPVTAFDPEVQTITTADGTVLEYDYAVIATGASLAFDQIPGFGPEQGYTHSVCTAQHALATSAAWRSFLEQPGPMVVGAAPGAGCFGPIYEFVLMAEWLLRDRGLRDQVDITLVTPEPYVGHLGVGGLKHSREVTTALLQERGIKVIEDAAITAIAADTITLEDGRQLPHQFSMILPAFRGAKFLRQTPGLANAAGFVPILPNCRHPRFPQIYALGVSVHLAQPEPTRVPLGLPKTGQMTEAMGMAVAHNLAVELGVLTAPPQIPTLDALCIAEFGDRGIAYVAAPVLPDPVTGQRRHSAAIEGRWVVWAKAAFERYYLLKMKFGVGVPWFERLGLRWLFSLSLLTPLPTPEHHQADGNWFSYCALHPKFRSVPLASEATGSQVSV